MTRQDVCELMNQIIGIYPNFVGNRDPTVIINAWHSVLENEHTEDIFDALKRYIKEDTKGFPPVPGQLIALAQPIYDDHEDWGWWEEEASDDEKRKVC